MAVGFKFSLILSRKISKSEINTLREAGCEQAEFGTDTLPTDASVPVARLDFDDTKSQSLEEAIESGLAAVKAVPDLGIPGLNVPAQPAHLPAAEHEDAGDLVDALAEE